MANIGTNSSGLGTTESSKVDEVRDGAVRAAHDVRDEVGSAVTDVRQEAEAQLAHVRDEAMERAQDLFGETRRQVGTQADQGTRQLAGTLSSAGRELTGMAERSEEDGPMTHLVRQLGDRATSMGDRFQEGGYKALAEDLTRFARSSPGMFLLAAAGAGFAVGRVVRNADTKAIAQAARGDGDGTQPALGRPGGGFDSTAGRDGEIDLRSPSPVAPGVGAMGEVR